MMHTWQLNWTQKYQCGESEQVAGGVVLGASVGGGVRLPGVTLKLFLRRNTMCDRKQKCPRVLTQRKTVMQRRDVTTHGVTRGASL